MKYAVYKVPLFERKKLIFDQQFLLNFFFG